MGKRGKKGKEEISILSQVKRFLKMEREIKKDNRGKEGRSPYEPRKKMGGLVASVFAILTAAGCALLPGRAVEQTKQNNPPYSISQFGNYHTFIGECYVGNRVCALSGIKIDPGEVIGKKTKDGIEYDMIRTRDGKIYGIESNKEFIGKTLPDIWPPALVQLLRGPTPNKRLHLIIKDKTKDLPDIVDPKEYKVRD